MPFSASTQADLLALWRSLYDPSYTAAIESEASGQGLDVYAVQAKIFSRASVAGQETFGRLFIRPHSTQVSPPASGAAYAVTDLVLFRSAPAHNAFTLIAGTELVATLRTPTGVTIDGAHFRVLHNTTIPAGSLTVQLTVQAVRVGESSNVVAGSIAKFASRGTATITSATIEAGNVLRDRAGAFGGDRLTPAMIGQYVLLVGGVNGGTSPRRVLSVTQPTAADPTASAVLDGPALTAPDTLTRADVVEFADLGLSVSQPSDAVGGLDAWLDALGAERLIFRQAGETDAAYRVRIESLPDVVSPGAILRAASRVLSPLGIGWKLVETRDPVSGLGVVWDWSAFDAGDLGAGPPWVFLPMTRWFALIVGFGSQGEIGFPYDATTPRLSNAYDAPGPAHNFYDGQPYAYLAAIAALWADINQRRASGVAFSILRSTAV